MPEGLEIEFNPPQKSYWLQKEKTLVVVYESWVALGLGRALQNLAEKYQGDIGIFLRFRRGVPGPVNVRVERLTAEEEPNV